MKSILKIQSIALVFLLICSVFVSPVMAGDSQENVVEDGVHLVKLSDSPTKLDHHFYDVDPTVNFVVDGNQYYWVRIGNVNARDLSTNAVAYFVCKGVIIVGAAGVAYASAPLIAGGSGASVAVGGATFTVTAGQLAALVGAGIGYIADVTSAICSEVEKQFVDNNYRYVASDGTILIGIAKTNTAGIQEMKKTGLDITKLTHLSSDGSLVPKLDL